MTRVQNLVGICAVLALASPCLSLSSHAEDVASYRQRQDKATPASVLAWLKAGNLRFMKGLSEHGGYPIDARDRVKISATGQRPLAVVLSCIDSRTTPELVFDVAVGDLFTPRVGANVINDDVLGSLEISVASGAKVVVVMGHTDCGGVKGACNGLELGHATQMLDKVKSAIASTNARLDADPVLSQLIGNRAATNPKYVAEVSHANAHQSLEQILQRSPVLKEQVDKGEIILISALYHVETGEVTFDEK